MREFYRKKLNKLLGAANYEDFVQLLWATHALQSEYAESARKFIRPETIPAGAITTDMNSDFRIQKWEIETLANEIMTVPKNKPRGRFGFRALKCDSLEVSLACVDWLRKLENAESEVKNGSNDILVEIARVAARQFNWQTGYANIPQFYRNAFVYGQGKCAKYFENKYGISLNQFSQIGFMLFTLFTKGPVVSENDSWAALNVEWEDVERVLGLIALPFPEAAKRARSDRKKFIRIAGKPSVLRQTPCLRFGKNGERIRAPLPELILERVTSGVFYDVVSGAGPIRDDYGRRFEDYCANYLCDSLPRFDWEREFTYRKKPNKFATPDILCSETGHILFAFECKATRMSHQAMFGSDPMGARGYNDLAKAVFQVWRFFSHCRCGYVDRAVADNAMGIVLTLDNWLVLADPLRKQVLNDAACMAEGNSSEITATDKRPIIFVAMPELERVLATADEAAFKDAVHKSYSDEYSGWRLEGVLRELQGDRDCEQGGYLYAEDLGKLLPWWDDLNRAVESRARQSYAAVTQPTDIDQQ